MRTSRSLRGARTPRPYEPTAASVQSTHLFSAVSVAFVQGSIADSRPSIALLNLRPHSIALAPPRMRASRSPRYLTRYSRSVAVRFGSRAAGPLGAPAGVTGLARVDEGCVMQRTEG